MSTPMHRQKVIRISSSVRAKTLDVSVDGVALARCNSLQKAPQRRRRINATCGSTIPTSSSCDNRILALVCFLEIKEEQNSWSPMGIPRISILGLSDFFMHNGNMSRPCRLNTSHLGRLTIIPRAGPSSWSKDRILHNEDLGPATAPSSKYQAWNGMLEQAVSLAIFITKMFKTSENSRGPSGSPCWTPDSDVKQPKWCQRRGCCP